MRALYFAVSGFMQMFHLLHYGFASIITILGIKMLLSDVYKVPITLSLVLIVFILLTCVIASLLRPRKADLKLMFERTERLGLIPFRQLLLIENIIDFGELKVRSAMRRRSDVQVIRLDTHWEENLRMIRETGFSRYPLVASNGARPLVVLHVKDLVLRDAIQPITADRLRKLARPCLKVNEDLPLEEALTRFQRRNDQIGIVFDAQGEWTGIITVEDILEEIVGRIGDEFDPARANRFISLADALSPGRILLQLRAQSMSEAIQNVMAYIPQEDLPANPQTMTRALLKRELTMSTYIRHGVAVVRGRLDGIDRPVLALGRSEEGVPIEGTNERAELIFLLLIPSGMPRIQPPLIADIVDLFDSEYLTERLRKAETPEEIIEAIRAGQQVVID